MITAVETLPPPGRGPEGLEPLLGAFSPGRLSEIVGPGSSGTSSLLLALMTRTTVGGGVVALVDVADGFDPTSAAAAGADLSRLLWVKCGARLRAGWSAADLLARCPGFALVVLDLGDLSSTRGDPASAVLCRRLQRAAEASGAVLVLRALQPLAGSAASLVVSLRRLETRWTGLPRATRFAGLTSEARILRARSVPSPLGGEGQGEGGARWLIRWHA